MDIPKAKKKSSQDEEYFEEDEEYLDAYAEHVGSLGSLGSPSSLGTSLSFGSVGSLPGSLSTSAGSLIRQVTDSELFQNGVKKVKDSEIFQMLPNVRESELFQSGVAKGSELMQSFSLQSLSESELVKVGVVQKVKNSELYQYISAACEEMISPPVSKKKEIWSRNRTLVRGKKLCSFIVFALSEYLTLDAISNIMPLFYQFVSGANGKVTTIGGKRDAHKQFENGPLETALFDNPFGVYFDRNDNLLVSEFGSHTIRLISPDDYVVKTIAGKVHNKGDRDGPGADSTFWIPVQFCEDKNGDYIVVDSFNNNYRRITNTNGSYTVSTIDLGFTMDENHEPVFNEVSACHDIYMDHNGDLVASDTCNHRIIKFVDGKFVPYSGPPKDVGGYLDGPLLESRWYKPSGIVVDRHGDIICCDYQNHCIRKINTKTEMVETIAGQGTIEGYQDGPAKDALFCHPNAVCLTLDDNILVADTDNQCIRQISPDGFVTTIAGTPRKIGSVDGKGPDASFNYPVNLCVDCRGDIFIADWKNDLIRKFTYDY